jgi:MHS family proline/betaine transporter-like MFS transporter
MTMINTHKKKEVGVVGSIAGASIGTLMQVYDSYIYGAVAVVLSSVIFGSVKGGLLFTFLAFGLGYLAGPIGSFFFGHLGDKLGRRYSMLISFWLIGGGTLFTGFIPSHASIGIWAPILLYALRIPVGFGSSGEWGSEGSYLIELGGRTKRGFYSAFQQFVVVGGLLGGTATGIIVTGISHEFLYSIGWRIPFIVGGALLIPIAFVLRMRMPESKSFEEVKEKQEIEKLPSEMVFTRDWKPAILTAFGAIVWEASFAIMLSYLPTYFATTTTITLHQGLIITTVGTAILMVFIPMWGYISDKFMGRKKVAMIAAIAYIILPYPLFVVMRGGNFYQALAAVSVLDFFIAPLSGTLVAWIGEQFPTNDRASAYIPYFISETVFFGFTGAIITYLINTTHNTLSPVFIATAAGIVAVICFALMKETAHLESLPDDKSIYSKES